MGGVNYFVHLSWLVIANMKVCRSMTLDVNLHHFV